jgi:hypothetical protein
MDPRSHATNLLETHLETIDLSLQKEAAFAYQDSMQMKAGGRTKESQDYTHQKRVFLSNVADAILEICLERFRNYTDVAKQS